MRSARVPWAGAAGIGLVIVVLECAPVSAPVAPLKRLAAPPVSDNVDELLDSKTRETPPAGALDQAARNAAKKQGEDNAKTYIAAYHYQPSSRAPSPRPIAFRDEGEPPMQKRLATAYQAIQTNHPGARIACSFRPCFLGAVDFDGDNRRELIIQVRDTKSQKAGLAVHFANGKTALLGAGKADPPELGDDFGWMRGWEVVVPAGGTCIGPQCDNTPRTGCASSPAVKGRAPAAAPTPVTGTALSVRTRDNQRFMIQWNGSAFTAGN